MLWGPSCVAVCSQRWTSDSNCMLCNWVRRTCGVCWMPESRCEVGGKRGQSWAHVLRLASTSSWASYWNSMCHVILQPRTFAWAVDSGAVFSSSWSTFPTPFFRARPQQWSVGVASGWLSLPPCPEASFNQDKNRTSDHQSTSDESKPS